MRTRVIVLSAILLGVSGSGAWAAPALCLDPAPPAPGRGEDGFIGASLDLTVTPPVSLPPAAAPAAEPGEPTAPAQDIPVLPGIPSALFLGVFGLVCVGFVRGRHRLAGLLVAVFTVCQAGLGSLPRLMAAHGRSTVRASVAGPGVPNDPTVRPVDVTPDVDFVGLLRRLGTRAGDAAAGSSTIRPYLFGDEPAVRTAEARSSAGFSWRANGHSHPFALFPNGAAVRPDGRCIIPPRPACNGLSSETIPHALFARPPPALA